MPEKEHKIEQAVKLAESSGYEKKHTEQVRRLALKIFDELGSLHQGGEKERSLLEQAAILHDIGGADGAKDHHKHSRDMILASTGLLFDDEEERRIVAQIARYHKGSLPKKKHRHHEMLSAKAKRTVEKMASILRIADGLDRTHSAAAEDVKCEVLDDKVVLTVKGKAFSDVDGTAALDKSDLFKKTFGKEIEIDGFSE